MTAVEPEFHFHKVGGEMPCQVPGAPCPDFRIWETTNPPRPLGMHRQRHQTHTERRTDSIHGVKARRAVWA